MAKRVFFTPGVEAMSGILGSRAGKLVYAENDNPAYEAPVGVNYARNYGARIVLATRAKDGKAYFSVKTKSATKISATTRMQMALIGSIAAIKSVLKSNGTLATIKSAYDYSKEHGTIDASLSFNKWVDANLRDMLRLHKATWAFDQASISFTVHNPYDLTSADAVAIKQSLWVKFAPLLAIYDFSTQKMAGFTINSQLHLACVAKAGTSFDAFIPTITNIPNPMYKANLVGLRIENEAVEWNNVPLYKDDVAVVADDIIEDGGKYVTL